MRPDSQTTTSVNNDNNDNNGGTQGLSEIDDDSGVSVSGNLSQSSNSSSGSGSDGDGVMIEVVDGDSQNSGEELEASNEALFEVQCKAEALAHFVISRTLGSKVEPSDEVEETLIRCARKMMTKHTILFNGMMRRFNINEETAYATFSSVANELFEGDKVAVTWGRVVALYAFGGQLALHCKNKQLRECEERIPIFVGRYAKDVISTFVHEEGGWKKLREEFPPDDVFDQRVWRVLTWTAVGLGLATAVSFLATH